MLREEQLFHQFLELKVSNLEKISFLDFTRIEETYKSINSRQLSKLIKFLLSEKGKNVKRVSLSRHHFTEKSKKLLVNFLSQSQLEIDLSYTNFYAEEAKELLNHLFIKIQNSTEVLRAIKNIVEMICEDREDEIRELEEEFDLKKFGSRKHFMELASYILLYP